MKPWLSVIMPVHCGEAWIGASLQSIADEAGEGIEVLILDSSPDPGTMAVARRFEGRLGLRLFPDSPLQSWPAKTNVAVQLAEADHLCLLHQDDLWLSGRVSAVKRWIGLAPEACLHLAGTTVVDRRGRAIGTWRCPFRDESVIEPSILLERLLVQNFVSTPAPVFRRDAWLHCGGFDERLWYTCDWDVWLKLAETGLVWHHPDITTGFRVHESSQTVIGSRNAEEFGKQLMVVFDRHLARLSRSRAQVQAVGLASIKVNRALAAAAGGQWNALLPALAGVVNLGPLGATRYLRDSRIVERVVPRIRAKLIGGF
jgi:glycosyltransferase involved in cell wall biosynthesis